MDKKFEKFCQSCSMPLKNGECSGTEKDGDKSMKYCSYCYEKGEFKSPDMTLEEMKKTVDDALKEKGWMKPLRWVSLMMLPRLERWKSKK